MEPYTITNLEAQFDVLIHAMVTQINDTLCPNKTVTLADGSTVKVLDEDTAGIGMGSRYITKKIRTISIRFIRSET